MYHDVQVFPFQDVHLLYAFLRGRSDEPSEPKRRRISCLQHERESSNTWRDLPKKRLDSSLPTYSNIP